MRFFQRCLHALVVFLLLLSFFGVSDDDWNDPSKQEVITNKLTFYVRHYNISEDEWNEIVKPYAEGLSGLPYSDFK